jgi:hypothetical protein
MKLSALRIKKVKLSFSDPRTPILLITQSVSTSRDIPVTPYLTLYVVMAVSDSFLQFET